MSRNSKNLNDASPDSKDIRVPGPRDGTGKRGEREEKKEEPQEKDKGGKGGKRNIVHGSSVGPKIKKSGENKRRK